MEELISVIVPVYKTEKYLCRCVKSILGQTYQNLEVILVDDGSTDSCPKLCDEFAQMDKRVKVIHKKNGGLSSARNEGLKYAQGSYIGFVDSDDWISPNMYSALIELLKLHPECDIAECGVIITNKEKEIPADLKKQEKVLDKRDMFNYFFRINGEKSNNGVWKYLLKKEILQSFAFTDTLNEDVEASYEFYHRANYMIQTNQKYYYYFVNHDGITNSRFTEKDMDYIKVWDRILKRTEREYPEYLEHAEFYRKRANFTMLGKMKLKGYDRQNDKLRKINHELKTAVRHDWMELMRGKLPLSRKLLLLYLMI